MQSFIACNCYSVVFDYRLLISDQYFNRNRYNYVEYGLRETDRRDCGSLTFIQYELVWKAERRSGAILGGSFHRHGTSGNRIITRTEPRYRKIIYVAFFGVEPMTSNINRTYLVRSTDRNESRSIEKLFKTYFSYNLIQSNNPNNLKFLSFNLETRDANLVSEYVRNCINYDNSRRLRSNMLFVLWNQTNRLPDFFDSGHYKVSIVQSENLYKYIPRFIENSCNYSNVELPEIFFAQGQRYLFNRRYRSRAIINNISDIQLSEEDANIWSINSYNSNDTNTEILFQRKNINNSTFAITITNSNSHSITIPYKLNAFCELQDEDGVLKTDEQKKFTIKWPEESSQQEKDVINIELYKPVGYNIINTGEAVDADLESYTKIIKLNTSNNTVTARLSELTSNKIVYIDISRDSVSRRDIRDLINGLKNKNFFIFLTNGAKQYLCHSDSERDVNNCLRKTQSLNVYADNILTDVQKMISKIQSSLKFCKRRKTNISLLISRECYNSLKFEHPIELDSYLSLLNPQDIDFYLKRQQNDNSISLKNYKLSSYDTINQVIQGISD
jgi:hypothetical protein